MFIYVYFNYEKCDYVQIVFSVFIGFPNSIGPSHCKKGDTCNMYVCKHYISDCLNAYIYFVVEYLHSIQMINYKCKFWDLWSFLLDLLKALPR